MFTQEEEDTLDSILQTLEEEEVLTTQTLVDTAETLEEEVQASQSLELLD